MTGTNPGAAVNPSPAIFPSGTTSSPPPPGTGAYTTTEILTIDGVSMNTWATNMVGLLAALRAPAKRNNNVTIPGRHGTLRTRQKYYSENTLSFPMWVQGAAHNGSLPGGSNRRIQFQARVDELVTLINKVGRLDVRLLRADGTTRQCYAECLEVLDFSGVNGPDPFAALVVTLTLPDVFWQDIDPVTQTFTNPTMDTTLALTSLTGTQAPIEDAVITLTGPWTNAVVETYVNGSPLEVRQYVNVGTIATGKTVILDCGTWAVSGTNQTPYANVLHLGTRLLTILPSSALGTPQIHVNGSGTTSGTAISVQARRKYLVG